MLVFFIVILARSVAIFPGAEILTFFISGSLPDFTTPSGKVIFLPLRCRIKFLQIPLVKLCSFPYGVELNFCFPPSRFPRLQENVTSLPVIPFLFLQSCEKQA